MTVIWGGDGHLKLLDHTFPSPEENLACDEVLLDLCESGRGCEVLRFWESPSCFVVLGSSNKVHEEINVDACNADGIPILRRHSGGGTVLQGPGCLNYSLILRIDPHGATRNITATTNSIMNRHAEAFSISLNARVEVKGSSDLAIAGRKFSGNAQRRKLKALFFHGTFLLDFDLALMERYLKMPPKQPDYRARRRHVDFVRSIGADRSLLKGELKRHWNVAEELTLIPHQRIAELAREKYSRSEWNFKL